MENVKNGGAGSGDFNHAGNPPHVGGSEPVESRHARGFKSKSEKHKKAVEERHKYSEIVKKHEQAYKDFEKGKISMEELDKADKEMEQATKDFYGEEKSEDKKVAETKIIEGGIKETTDKYGRIVLSKKDSNKKVKIHKNGNYFLASYGQELKDNDGYTEFQVFPSASGKSFKTEKGAKKWALEKLKETANNSLYKHEFIEY